MSDDLPPGARRVFGETPGGVVEEAALAGGGLRARVIGWGAGLRDLRLDGVDRPLVLGFDDLASYVADPAHVGVVAGRCANRIGGGRFTLDGRAVDVGRNMGAHHLHGGAAAFGRRVWRLVDAAPDRAAFELVSPDGDGGYPGRLVARVTYTLRPPAALSVEISAQTDAPTPVNLAHHAYFTLQEGPDARVCTLEIAAETFTETDADLIPTGRLLPVAGTPFDFRAPRVVGARGALHDLNYCLATARRAAPAFAARLTAPDGLSMEVRTTEPGLQLYDAQHLGEGVGLDGRPFGRHAGLCLEAQGWPDGVNRPAFPSVVLRPGETYRQVTEWRFSAG